MLPRVLRGSVTRSPARTMLPCYWASVSSSESRAQSPAPVGVTRRRSGIMSPTVTATPPRGPTWVASADLTAFYRMDWPERPKELVTEGHRGVIAVSPHFGPRTKNGLTTRSVGHRVRRSSSVVVRVPGLATDELNLDRLLGEVKTRRSSQGPWHEVRGVRESSARRRSEACQGDAYPPQRSELAFAPGRDEPDCLVLRSDPEASSSSPIGQAQ